MLRRYSKTIAVLLLLVFSQKAGLRLWMHHWLHASKTISSYATPGSDKIQLACDCFEDAMLPLQKTAIFTLTVPTQKATELGSAPQSPTPDTEAIYYSLKGPPPSLSLTPLCS
ncbi:hypothetical protein [Puia dinghuensis]|nr:hypothetical protein [Puia dinghuensis]